MDFRYRFVPYGTSFTPSEGLRPDSSCSVDAIGLLYDNEIVVDVGGATWGCSGCDFPVIDHHFPRDDGGQFPSASSAVLHLAQRIADHFELLRAKADQGVIWLVSHRSPDFDAFCALYLVRQVISSGVPWSDGRRFGMHPLGWLETEDRKRLDWFNPIEIARLREPAESRARALILLASIASCTDNGKSLAVPKTKALHSVLYAAMRRGRPYEGLTNGATELFDDAVSRIEENHLNPLFDSILDGSSRFAPELALLAHEAEAYNRDLNRARVAVVNVQRALVPFKEFYDPLADAPLLGKDGNLAPTSIPVKNQCYVQLDAVFLLDPECLLFKEWARLDMENSPSGKGFQFTAIAYSNGRPDAELNRTDYYFALDPESASGRHLYGVWAHLQAAEAKALRARHDVVQAPPRRGFEKRAGQEWSAEFGDPWFDAPNYDCTIIATPNRGSVIGSAGIASDLSDDPVVAVARSALENTIYVSEFRIQDIPAITVEPTGTIASLGEPAVTGTRATEAPSGHFRFVAVQLHENVDCRNEQVAAQIGDALWQALMPDARPRVPGELRSSHLLVASESIAVWSRRGVGIAYSVGASKLVEQVRRDLFEVAALSVEIQGLTAQSVANSETPVSKTFALLIRAVQLQHHLSLPEGRLLRQFYEALRLGDFLQLIGDLHADAINRRQLKELQATMNSQLETQSAVEWLEVIILTVYCTELVEILLRTASSGPGHYWDLAALVFVGFSAFGLTMWHLRPWTHSPRKRGGLVPALLLLLVLLVVGAVIWRQNTERGAPNPPPPGLAAAEQGLKQVAPKNEGQGVDEKGSPRESGLPQKAEPGAPRRSGSAAK